MKTYKEVETAIKQMKAGKVKPINKLFSDEEPNAKTKRAICDVKKGKVTRCNSVEDMMNKLNA